MAIYATKQDLEDRDGSMLYNFALDRSTDTLNDTWIDEALATADDEINGYLSRRYVLPLPTVPDLLKRQAIVIAFYWLGDRDNQVTDLLQKRYDSAIAKVKEIAAGKLDLGLPTPDQPPEGAVGKVELVQENERLFTRDSLRGVL
ncbi:gp436 family protein [Aeromonas dhakensis]|jgi:phage gp36-like protein|uniref:gp436 family protein n=1 Tax=Aeromonas dhakensis TaxID=196024 RepID=UPI003CEF6887